MLEFSSTFPDNAPDLEAAVAQARYGVQDSHLNHLGLPSLLRGHTLAEPTVKSVESESSEDALDRGSIAVDQQIDSTFFTRLPGEIRTLIYEEFLGRGTAKFCPSKGYRRGARGAAVCSALPLLLSCRRMQVQPIPLPTSTTFAPFDINQYRRYHEANKVLYSSNTWWLLNGTPLLLPAYLTPTHLHSIRHVTLSFHAHMVMEARGSMNRYEWLGTWLALSQLPSLQTLDATVYAADTAHWSYFTEREADFLRPVAVVTRPKKFVLRLRWPEGEADLGFLPCEVRREYEGNRMAEQLRIAMDRVITDFPHRYCNLGWKEDSRRNPEAINECYPIPSQEGRRKGFLRTYRSIAQSQIAR